MFVTGHYYVVASYGDFICGISLWATEKTDGVECYFKFWTGANEGASHRFYLRVKGLVCRAFC